MSADHKNTDERGMSVVDVLREWYAQASPAPWDAVISTGCVRYLGKPIEPLEHGDYVANCRGLDAASANSHLIAAMHHALPDLLRLFDTARAAIREDGSVFVGKCEAVAEALARLEREAP